MIIKFKYLVIFIAALSFCVKAKAQTTTGKWNGFEQVNFTIGAHKAYYVKPAKPLPGNPWVWRASFADWHIEMDTMLLSRGFYIAYVSVDDQYGSPYAMQVWDKFYQYLTKNIALAPKTSLEAVSRGGLYALNWAKRNPDKVNCIYAETPVYDFKSWPGNKGKGPGDTTLWKQLKQVYNFTEQQAISYKDNPIDNLEGLASFKVPVMNVIGLDDKLAPPAENSLLFAERYIALGGPVATYPVTEGPQELSGHHFPLKHAKEFADFIYYNSYPVKSVLPYNKYYTVRGGLPNFYNAVTVRKQATVGFLGGSITFNPGWRDKVCAFLKENYPQTDFHFIAAGIPSLGSLAHTFRVQRDILDSGKVDLLFVEAAVNDRGNLTDSLTQVRDLEGIVRQAKKSNPMMEVILMSLADGDKTGDYTKGITPIEIKNHELVATHYNSPSINLGREVYEKIKNNEFNWNDDFKDIHPAHFGQELYFATIKDLLFAAFKEAADSKHKPTAAKLPALLNKASFENGTYYNITNAQTDKTWTLDKNWDPKDGLSTRPGYINVPVLYSTQAGGTLTLPFTGTAVGMAIASGPDEGIVSYTIDGKTYKDIDLFTPYSTWLHIPTYLLFEGDLKRGKHTLILKITPNKNNASNGTACHIVYFLVNK
ncbi:hypothetical protein GCM10023149_00640 [Mucilaginibacter gynuensis]|uniref:SGNH hydrolase-type esterase domain-containing protein n=1 Tax=Mucilaginibacter gynuensis TaxID=1302236 RepID=A0ABP8FMH0_9SPHI